jgi:NADPH2:quinone reductase
VGGDTLAQSLKCIGYRGRAITVGNASRDVRQYDIRTLGGMNQSITGVFLGAEIATPRARAMIDGHLRDVAKGELKVLVDREFALADAAEAHRYIESRSAVGRVLLLP